MVSFFFTLVIDIILLLHLDVILISFFLTFHVVVHFFPVFSVLHLLEARVLLDVLFGVLVAFKAGHGKSFLVQQLDHSALVEHQLDHTFPFLLIQFNFLVLLAASADRVS